MSADIAAEIWSELKRYINSVDRSEAAMDLVNILIDNDSDIDDIKEAFKGDQDIKRALAGYLDSQEEEEEEEEEDDSDWDD